MSNEITGSGQLTRDNSFIKELLTHPEKRKSLGLFCKVELQRNAGIIHESCRALISVIKRLRFLEEVLAFIVTRMVELINARRCSLFVIEQDPDRQKFAMLVASFPLAPLKNTYGITLSLDEYSALAEDYDTGEPLPIDNAQKSLKSLSRVNWKSIPT